jgi:hypothetical protein
VTRAQGIAAALLALTVVGCSEPDPNAEAVAAYLATAEDAGAAKIADVTSSEDVLTGLILSVRGEAGCRAAYDPALPGFAHQIVFGALDGLERATDPAAVSFENQSIWGKDATRATWDAACAAMRETRERYLDCRLREDTLFLLGVFTLAHYEGREASHGESYAAAQDLMRVGSREHEAPLLACDNS